MNSTVVPSDIEIVRTIRFSKIFGITISFAFPLFFFMFSQLLPLSDVSPAAQSPQTIVFNADTASASLVNPASTTIPRSEAQPLSHMLTTVLVTLFGIVLGLLSYYFLVKVPVMGMKKATEAARESLSQLDRERLEKEKALRRVEYSGQALRHLATHDLLTDLPNRTYLEGALRELIARGGNASQFFSLILLDLNRFKDINDSLGHQSGDLVIREVARRLSRAAPSPCTVVRLDGDEFAILNPGPNNREEAIRFCNSILEALEVPLAMKGYSLDTSATLGVAFYPQHGEDPDTLMQHADIAMYIAKNKRKEMVLFDESMQLEQLNHLSLRGDLRRAIDAGDLEVHYQPKISLQTGYIYGVEALARWVHPERGAVSPALFIPIAEQTGLIHPLTGLVLNVSLNQAAQWQLQRQHIGVAINISVRSLHDPHLPERVQVLLETWNIPANMITLEITESAIMADPAKALDVLTELSEMGLQVSVDDYGTGYSSLSYLKRLPVKEIKIDRSFVGDMLNNENDKVIVRATIDMAHDLGLVVTAEGVEDEATWEQLRKFGCDNAQGFYMGKPQTAASLNDWLVQSPWGNPSSLIQ